MTSRRRSSSDAIRTTSARADHFEPALERVGDDQEHRQGDERRHAAARQHAVVDLQHVERPGEHEHVHHAREQATPQNCPPAFLERGGELRMGLLQRCECSHHLMITLTSTGERLRFR